MWSNTSDSSSVSSLMGLPSRLGSVLVRRALTQISPPPEPLQVYLRQGIFFKWSDIIQNLTVLNFCIRSRRRLKLLQYTRTGKPTKDYHPESPLDGIPTGRNPHWTESPPEFQVSVGIQDSGNSWHRGTESPPDFCSC